MSQRMPKNELGVAGYLRLPSRLAVRAENKFEIGAHEALISPACIRIAAHEEVSDDQRGDKAKNNDRVDSPRYGAFKPHGLDKKPADTEKLRWLPIPPGLKCRRSALSRGSRVFSKTKLREHCIDKKLQSRQADHQEAPKNYEVPDASQEHQNTLLPEHVRQQAHDSVAGMVESRFRIGDAQTHGLDKKFTRVEKR